MCDPCPPCRAWLLPISNPVFSFKARAITVLMSYCRGAKIILEEFTVILCCAEVNTGAFVKGHGAAEWINLGTRFVWCYLLHAAVEQSIRAVRFAGNH